MTSLSLELFNQQYIEFVGDLAKRHSSIGLTFSSFPLDHVCYRADSLETYTQLFDFFKSQSVLYTTKLFHDRHFHAFVLRKPLEFGGAKFHYLEFAEPGGSDDYALGFQHFEFMTNKILSTVIPESKLTELLFKSKYGEEYLKWPDKIAVKFTAIPQITKALLEDNSEIVVKKA